MNLQRARPLKGWSRPKVPPEVHAAPPPPRRKGSRGWSRPIELGAVLRLQAMQGHRAAVVALRPGLWLVAALPEEKLRTELGFLPLLAPLLTTAAARALRDRRPAVPRAFREEPPVEWAEPEDIEAVMGSAGKGSCGC